MIGEITLPEAVRKAEIERCETFMISARVADTHPPEASFLTASDELLLKRVGDGDKNALGVLFHRHTRAVRNIAHRSPIFASIPTILEEHQPNCPW